MGYEFENWKDFGSVMLHHERPHTQFRLNETCFMYILNCFASCYTQWQWENYVHFRVIWSTICSRPIGGMIYERTQHNERNNIS